MQESNKYDERNKSESWIRKGSQPKLELKEQADVHII